MMTECAECGFRFADLRRADVGTRITEEAREVTAVLATTDPVALRVRPEPQVWSPIEYAGHIRDVLLAQRDRIGEALRTDRPDWVSLGMGAWVDARHYDRAEPAVLIGEIDAAAAGFAELCAGLRDTDWDRIGTYHWPDTGDRDVTWLARFTAHEVHHHLQDMRRGLVDGSAG